MHVTWQCCGTQAGAPSIQGWGREKDQLSQETVFLTDTLGLGGRAWVHRPRRVRQGRFGIEKSLGIYQVLNLFPPRDKGEGSQMEPEGEPYSVGSQFSGGTLKASAQGDKRNKCSEGQKGKPSKDVAQK